jgi:hypothetical protein
MAGFIQGVGLSSVAAKMSDRQRVPHAAFARTSSRYPKATTVAGLGDKAVYDREVGIIALFGDTAFDAFIPQGNLTDAQLSAIEKSLILALRNKL